VSCRGQEDTFARQPLIGEVGGRRRNDAPIWSSLRANGEGLQIGIVITPGQAHDVGAFPVLMQEIDCDSEQMPGDKGYDSESVWCDIAQLSGKAAVRTTATRKIRHAVDNALYALRNRIERFFDRVKERTPTSPLATTS
jgi:transposase